MKVTNPTSPDPLKWVVLFGGAGRESSIIKMVQAGVKVSKVVVPKQRNDKLNTSIERLVENDLEIMEVERNSLVYRLAPLAGAGLLSIGFPYVLTSQILSSFQPAINLHPTLLPKYRGPTTAAYVLINNEAVSGSTVHFMTEEVDRGPIICQSEVIVDAFDTVRSLQRRVYESEPMLLLGALEMLNSGATGVPQDEQLASYFPKKRSPADSEIDPKLPLIDLIHSIRACDPDEFPAFFIYRGEKVCIKLWRPVTNRDIPDAI